MRRFQVSGVRYQVPGSRLQGSGDRYQVPEARKPGTMCQVLGIKCHVKILKTFTLKTFYVLTKLQTYFTSQRKLETYKHHDNIFFIQWTKLFIANSKMKALFWKMKKKTQVSPMQLSYNCWQKPSKILVEFIFRKLQVYNIQY